MNTFSDFFNLSFLTLIELGQFSDLAGICCTANLAVATSSSSLVHISIHLTSVNQEVLIQ